ncbi:DUF4870 domain-containing protein [Chloroflexota bacterium]
MKLSLEERKRIYEEEKTRIEEEQKLEKEIQKAGGKSIASLDPNIAGLLCYLGVWVTGVIFLVLEKKSMFVRFHAIQSIIVFGVLGIANAILSQMPIVGWFFSIITGILIFILWILLMVKAYHSELYKIPLAGDIAEKASGVVYPRDSEQDKYAKPPEQPVPPLLKPERGSVMRVNDKMEDYPRTGKVGRITSSSFAIAWSIVFLIFLNFFNKYIVYYQYESGEWARYPILTADFNVWLPIITATLAFSIVGHIILVVFDKYLVRETTIMILNLFGIAATATMLSIFPFDFGAIPNLAVAGVLPVIAALVLIGIGVGLGITTLVRFIRLIICTATGTVRY